MIALRTVLLAAAVAIRLPGPAAAGCDDPHCRAAEMGKIVRLADKISENADTLAGVITALGGTFPQVLPLFNDAKAIARLLAGVEHHAGVSGMLYSVAHRLLDRYPLTDRDREQAAQIVEKAHREGGGGSAAVRASRRANAEILAGHPRYQRDDRGGRETAMKRMQR